MARPLRINIPDGWYHVMSRGIEKRDIFTDNRDREHFLELLDKAVTQFGVLLHAYVLMGNHYHLLLQTPAANLSEAMQWLNVSYGIWYNRKHNRVGPLFQGRFKSKPVEENGAWALSASVYLHLNPVRIKELGYTKHDQKAERSGVGPMPSPLLVKARLEMLRSYRWSSYQAYAGYCQVHSWLTCGELWRRAKYKNLSCKASYRRYIENFLKAEDDKMRNMGEHFQKCLAFGSNVFLDKLRREISGDSNEQKDVRAWRRLLPFSKVVEAVSAEKGEQWDEYCSRHGDSGRDIALWLGRKHCGLTLAELGRAAGGMAYPAVGFAVRNIEKRLQTDRQLQKTIEHVERKFLNL